MRYLPALNGLRGYAFINVLLNHLIVDQKGAMVQFGVFGVSMFFQLSSYLLTQPLYERLIEGKGMNIINYFIRRVFRIYPLLTICLFVDYYFNLGGFVSKFETLVSVYFLYGSYHFYWTIYVEMRYYLFIPVVVFLYYKIKKGFIKVIISLLILILSFYFLYLENGIVSAYATKDQEGLAANKLFFAHLPNFLAGSIMAILVFHLDSYGYNFKAFPKLNSLVIFILSVLHFLILGFYYILKLRFNVNTNWGDNIEDFNFIWGILYSMLVFSLNGNCFMVGFYESQILQFFGNVSYPGYLLHIPIRNVTCKVMGSSHTSRLLSLPFTLIISYLLHITVETFFINKTKNLCVQKEYCALPTQSPPEEKRSLFINNNSSSREITYDTLNVNSNDTESESDSQSIGRNQNTSIIINDQDNSSVN